MDDGGASRLYDRLDAAVRAEHLTDAVLTIKLLCGNRHAPHRLARLRRSAVQLVPQIAALYTFPPSPKGALQPDRTRLESQIRALAAEALELHANGVFAPDDIRAALAMLDSLPDRPGNPLGATIFISYRRADSRDVVGRLYDRLVAAFGGDAVFMDVVSMPLAVDFRAHVKEVLSRCRACLVVIGPDWLATSDLRGVRRLDDDRDMVIVEIETALRAGLLVVPVTVRNSTMPDARDLPHTIAELADRNGLAVRHDPDFNGDVERLIAKLWDEIARRHARGAPSSVK